MENKSGNIENQKIEIKEVLAENWKELRDHYLELLKTDPEAFADEFKEIDSRSEEKWREGLSSSNGATFVAKEDGKLVGMGRINFYDSIPGVPVLHKLGVLKEYRGQGIAKELVKVRERWAKERGAKRVRTYVVANRLKTIDFSKKNGYVEIELLKENIKRGDGSTVDVMVFEKDL